MKLYLAPMEGVVDREMRQVLTQVGGFDYCVTEFVRITERLMPPRVFHRLCPELLHGGKTVGGTPVIVQILGGLPEVMAANAQRAAQLGAPGIDINFGCPSKWTNRKAGGAILLKEPERIHQIVAAVRDAVPAQIPVSAKMRLGYDDTVLTLEIVDAIVQANADHLTVHARTKADGYKPPAQWEWLARIREHARIPVVANGDINSVEDFVRCRDISGCDQFMLGRGAIAMPDLALQIRAASTADAWTWQQVLLTVKQLVDLMQQRRDVKEQQVKGRVKQWFFFLRRNYDEADQLYQQLKKTQTLRQVQELIGYVDLP